jgi:hypothetical protein
MVSRRLLLTPKCERSIESRRPSSRTFSLLSSVSREDLEIILDDYPPYTWAFKN